MKKIKEYLKDYWPVFAMIIMFAILLAACFIGTIKISGVKYSYAKILIGDNISKEGQISEWNYSKNDNKVKVVFKDGSVYFTSFENVILIKGE